MTTKQILKAHRLMPNKSQYRQMLNVGFACLWVILIALIYSLV